MSWVSGRISARVNLLSVTKPASQPASAFARSPFPEKWVATILLDIISPNDSIRSRVLGDSSPRSFTPCSIFFNLENSPARSEVSSPSPRRIP